MKRRATSDEARGEVRAGMRPGPADRGLAFAEALALWLDRRFFDPILGLVLPGVGDFLTVIVGVFPVGVAWRRRLPAVVIARMLVNLAVDALVGAVPVAGDVFDVFFRAHVRNYELLSRPPVGRPRWSDWLVVGGAALLLLAALAVPVGLAVLIVRAVTG